MFLNPIGCPNIRQLIQKVVTGYTSGDISEAIMLTNNACDTRWEQGAARACSAIFFTRGRIRFLKAVKGGEFVEMRRPVCGQTFVYFGPNVGAFCEVFSALGGFAGVLMPL